MIRAIIILNERALRFVYQDKIPTYETLVIKNGYSTLANQRFETGNGNMYVCMDCGVDRLKLCILSVSFYDCSSCNIHVQNFQTDFLHLLKTIS